MNINIAHLTLKERNLVWVLKWAYYLFWMGLIVSPIVLPVAFAASYTLWFFHDAFWANVWAPEQWWPDWSEPKADFRYASRETMEAVCEYKRQLYGGRMRHPRHGAGQFPGSWSSSRMEPIYFTIVLGGVTVLVGWLFRKWGEWGLIPGLVTSESFVSIQYTAFLKETCTVPFAIIFGCVCLRYNVVGGITPGSLLKLCTLQSLQDVAVVAQPLLTWGENLLAHVVPAIPSGGSVEAWVGLDPLYTWMVQDSVVGGYLEGSGGLAQSRALTVQSLPQPLRLTALPRWAPSLPRGLGGSLQELASGATARRFYPWEVVVEDSKCLSTTVEPTTLSAVWSVPTIPATTFGGRVSAWLNYYVSYPLRLWAPVSVEVTDGWQSGTGQGSGPPRGGVSLSALESSPLPWRWLIIQQLGPKVWPTYITYDFFARPGYFHMTRGVMRYGPRPFLQHICWWLAGSCGNVPAAVLPSQAVAAPALTRTPTLQWGELFTPKPRELVPLHITKKFYFRHMGPLQFQAAVEVWKDLRQQQYACYSYYHRVVGAFYAAPTIPLGVEVTTAVPQGLWRKQPLAQWLLEEGERGGRSSFVASRSEICAELQALYAWRASRFNSVEFLLEEGLGVRNTKKPTTLKAPEVFRMRNPWIDGVNASSFFSLTKFTKLVAQQPLEHNSTPLEVRAAEQLRPPKGSRRVIKGQLGTLSLVTKPQPFWSIPRSVMSFWPLSILQGPTKGAYFQARLIKVPLEQLLSSRGSSGCYGEKFAATQGRLKALYWYEERVKYQLKVGGYALPAPGVLFDEGQSGWWYARQYFHYRLWNPLRRWCGIEVPYAMPALQRVSLVGAEKLLTPQVASNVSVPTTFHQITEVAPLPTYARAVKHGVVSWVTESGVLKVSDLTKEEVIVPDEGRGGVWRLKDLPVRWEQRLTAQALTSAAWGERQECHDVPTWVTDWWLGWLPTTYRLSVKWASLLPEWFTGARVTPPTLLAQVRAAAVERPVTWEVWAQEYTRPSLWATLAHIRQDGSVPVSPWDGGRYGFKLGVQPSSWEGVHWDLGGWLRNFWFSWSQFAYQFVTVGWAWGIDITYVLATEWARGTPWAEVCQLIFVPAWSVAQQQLIATFTPLGLWLFQGVAGFSVWGLSIGFNGVLLLVQVGLSIQEYLPAVVHRELSEAADCLPGAVRHWLSGKPPMVIQLPTAPLLGAKIQFQLAVRTVSLRSFLHHYWMEALLQREGVSGVAQRLVRNPQSWLATYRGIPQEQQFARLYKLLSSIEASAKRPLVYREGVPTERLNSGWLAAQMEDPLAGWRLREKSRGEVRYSLGLQGCVPQHIHTWKLRTLMQKLHVSASWQQWVFRWGDFIGWDHILKRPAYLQRFNAKVLRAGRKWLGAQTSISFEFKRSDSLIWPRFGRSTQHQDVVVHYRIPRLLFQKLYQYEYHHPLTWGALGVRGLAPLHTERAGGGNFWGWWPGRPALPTFCQAGLPPQHYYTRLEAEVLGPLLGFLREYNRFAFSSELHDNYYRKYGAIMAYMTFHYPQYTLEDIERVTVMPSDFRTRVVQGVSTTLPLEIQNHFITEPLKFSGFSEAQNRLLTPEFANEVRLQASWLTLMQEYFGPVGERRPFWRSLAETLVTPCEWNVQKGGVYPLSHWLPITLAAEAEEEAHAQLTRRGLKTFLREGESEEQREGKRYVFDRLHTAATKPPYPAPKKDRIRVHSLYNLPQWLLNYKMRATDMRTEEEKALKTLELVEKQFGSKHKVKPPELGGKPPELGVNTPAKGLLMHLKPSSYTLGFADAEELKSPIESKVKLPEGYAHFLPHGLLLKYPQAGSEEEEGWQLFDRNYKSRTVHQWHEVVKRAYKHEHRAPWWRPRFLFGKFNTYSWARFREGIHARVSADTAQGALLRRSLPMRQRRLYTDLFSRLEFQTIAVPTPGPVQWQQEQLAYTQSFFADRRFSHEEVAAVEYPVPDSRSEWAKANLTWVPTVVQPVVDWCQRWAVFLATFDLDHLRRIEGIQKDRSLSQWHFQERNESAWLMQRRKAGRAYKQVYLLQATQAAHECADSYGYTEMFTEVVGPHTAIKASAPHTWQDTYSSNKVWRPRGAVCKTYQRGMYIPLYDRLLPKGTPIRKPWDLKVNYTLRRPCARFRAVDWSGVSTVHQWIRNEGRARYIPYKLTPLWWQMSAWWCPSLSEVSPAAHGVSLKPEVRDLFCFGVSGGPRFRYFERAHLFYYYQWISDNLWWRWWRARLWGLHGGQPQEADYLRAWGCGVLEKDLFTTGWLPLFCNTYKKDWQPYYFLRSLTEEVPVWLQDYHKACVPLRERFIPSYVTAWHHMVAEGVCETGDLPKPFTPLPLPLPTIVITDPKTILSEDPTMLTEEEALAKGVEIINEEKLSLGNEFRVDLNTPSKLDQALEVVPKRVDSDQDAMDFLRYWSPLFNSADSFESCGSFWHLPWLCPRWIRLLKSSTVTTPLPVYSEFGGLTTVEDDVEFIGLVDNPRLPLSWGKPGVVKSPVEVITTTVNSPVGGSDALIVENLEQVLEESVPQELKGGELPVEESLEDASSVSEASTEGIEQLESTLPDDAPRLEEEWWAIRPTAPSSGLLGSQEEVAEAQRREDRGFTALPNLAFFRPYYLLNEGVEYVGRPDAEVSVERSAAARVYQQIEGVSKYYNDQQSVENALDMVRIPWGQQGVVTSRRGVTVPVNYYNFPSLRLREVYNSELDAYYSHSTKRTVPRALLGINFSGGGGLQFRYPEIFTPEQCYLQQRRIAAARVGWLATMWTNLTTLWQTPSLAIRRVRIDPPLYHNVRTYRSEPTALVELCQRLDADIAEMGKSTSSVGEGFYEALTALRVVARHGEPTEKQWVALQVEVASFLAPAAAEKYVAVEKRMAVLARELGVMASTSKQTHHKLSNSRNLTVRDLAQTVATEMQKAMDAEQKVKEERPSLTSRTVWGRSEELKVWRRKHAQKCWALRCEVEVWDSLQDSIRELLKLLVVVHDGPAPECAPALEELPIVEPSWHAKLAAWCRSLLLPRRERLTVPVAIKVPTRMQPDIELAVEDIWGVPGRIMPVTAAEWVKDVEGEESLDLIYDNYLAVRGVRALTAVYEGDPLGEGGSIMAENLEKGWAVDAAESYTRRAEAAKRLDIPAVVVPDLSMIADSASCVPVRGLVYPTSFNPFHYYNPHADQRPWWVKTRVWASLNYLRPVWARQASHCGAPINAPYERWREFSRASYHQQRSGLVWQYPAEMPDWTLPQGEESVAELRQLRWRQNLIFNECRRDFLRLCHQWNRLVILPAEVEEQSCWRQYCSRIYEGLRVENLLRRYIYTQAPYKRGFADYMRYRYALSYPTEIDPRCWVDPTLWDEARRGGYYTAGDHKVFYSDVQGTCELLPSAAPCAANAVAPLVPVVEAPRVVESEVRPFTGASQFNYPPYYYRPLGGSLDCERSKVGVRWEGPGTVISRATTTEAGFSTVPIGEVRAHECPTQVRAGAAFQRFTLPPLKHRSALSYMVNYHAERVWVPERQCYAAHQGWREYVVPNHCGVQGKRNLFWLNRWVGDPVLLRWDWNQEPVGVQAFLFNPKALKPQTTGFLAL